jgi:Inositol hexakisphosphate
MSTPIPAGKAPLNSDCPDANSGAIVLVLDAPAAKENEPAPSHSSLPKHFRTMTDDWHRTGSGNPPSRQGLETLNASGSAQYCKDQLQAMLSTKRVSLPMTIVDLRQESHGFFQLDQPLQGESTIAVGWFADRDWMSIGKGLVSVLADENDRLDSARQNPKLTVNEIKSVNSEGGICKMKPYPVVTVGWFTERQLARKAGIGYIRFPTTDHVRPRDEEVDRFVDFETTLAPGIWLHFHCRGGDGRTTTFLAMHDIIHNAPAVTVDNILIRQYWLGGVDLYAPPPTPTNYQYPFAVEREEFIRHFYEYVCAAKPGGFKLRWSAWVAQGTRELTSSV